MIRHVQYLNTSLYLMVVVCLRYNNKLLEMRSKEVRQQTKCNKANNGTYGSLFGR